MTTIRTDFWGRPVAMTQEEIDREYAFVLKAAEDEGRSLGERFAAREAWSVRSAESRKDALEGLRAVGDEVVRVREYRRLTGGSLVDARAAGLLRAL